LLSSHSHASHYKLPEKSMIDNENLKIIAGVEFLVGMDPIILYVDDIDATSFYHTNKTGQSILQLIWFATT